MMVAMQAPETLQTKIMIRDRSKENDPEWRDYLEAEFTIGGHRVWVYSQVKEKVTSTGDFREAAIHSYADRLLKVLMA